MKKALSLILALTLCLGLAIPTMAATNNSLETEDVYLLGDGTSTRMTPGVYWDAPFTGTSTETVFGKEVTVWHFPANAKIFLDNWFEYFGISEIERNGSDGDISSDIFNFSWPVELPKTDTIYLLTFVYNSEPKYFYVTLDANEEDTTSPAESLETEDVYLLGDGTSTRMTPGVYWNAPFTGTSTETVFGKKVTVWHFPANAKIALDDWEHRASMEIVSFSDEDGDGIKEEISYLSGDDIGTEPRTLGYADTVYILYISEYDFETDDTTHKKTYYIRLDEDPTVSAWAKEEISAARSARLIPELTGAPSMQDAITREQFAELVVNFLSVLRIGIETYGKDTISFTDCDNPAVLDAAIAGIVNGVGNNKFDPNATTNREQIATMLYRAIGYIKDIDDARGKDLAPKSGDIAKYTDKSAVSDWAVEGVGALAANGIMKGTSDTTLSPKNPCTVEQSIILIYRLYEAYHAN